MVIAMLVAQLCAIACVTTTEVYAFEVRRGATVPERLALAKSVTTEERVNRLKTQLLQRHPNLTPSDLNKIGIQWRSTLMPDKTGAEKQTIQVHVLLQPPRGVDGARIVEAAAEILDAEVKGPGLSGFTTDR